MFEQNYLNILKEVLNTGTKKSIFGHDDKYILSCCGNTLKFDLTYSFPVITTRKIAYKLAFKEMLWFIKGNGNVVDLHKQGCKWWDEWGLKYYNKNFVESNLTLEEYYIEIDKENIEFNEIPLHYTNITKWMCLNINKYEWFFLDQSKWIIDQIKKNPDRKSYLVNYWNPEYVYQMADECGNDSVVLPACHFYHQVLINDNKLDLIVGIRSSDLFLGLPANIVQYALLANMYAHCLNYKPGKLIIQLGDYHIYSDHLKQVEELVSRDPLPFPTLEINKRDQKYLTDFIFEDFNVLSYIHREPLQGDLTIVGGY